MSDRLLRVGDETLERVVIALAESHYACVDEIFPVAKPDCSLMDQDCLHCFRETIKRFIVVDPSEAVARTLADRLRTSFPATNNYLTRKRVSQDEEADEDTRL